MHHGGINALIAKKKEVAAFMRRLYRRHLTTSLGGNISLRFDATRVLITPSGVDKGTLGRHQIGLVSLSGANQTPGLPLSMETGMHLAIYRRRSDVHAVVHAHPVTASAFAASGKKINPNLLAESRAMIRVPATASYALMGTERLADHVAAALADTDAVLMENHGAVTVGNTLLSAFERMEVLESAARLTLITTLLGDCRELTADQLSGIDRLMSP